MIEDNTLNILVAEKHRLTKIVDKEPGNNDAKTLLIMCEASIEMRRKELSEQETTPVVEPSANNKIVLSGSSELATARNDWQRLLKEWRALRDAAESLRIKKREAWKRYESLIKKEKVQE